MLKKCLNNNLYANFFMFNAIYIFFYINYWSKGNNGYSFQMLMKYFQMIISNIKFIVLKRIKDIIVMNILLFYK